MTQLNPINYNNQRVLTTAQLAEAYGTEQQIIVNNFNRNKERYTEGKHYIALRGEEKRQFLCENQIDFSNKDHSTFYLWTEKGAWMHAKSLNTDAAWSAYEMLVDDYYNVRLAPALTAAEIIAAIANQAVEQERRRNGARRRTACSTRSPSSAVGTKPTKTSAMRAMTDSRNVPAASWTLASRTSGSAWRLKEWPARRLTKLASWTRSQKTRG